MVSTLPTVTSYTSYPNKNRGYLRGMTTNQVCNFVADMLHYHEGPARYPRRRLHKDRMQFEEHE